MNPPTYQFLDSLEPGSVLATIVGHFDESGRHHTDRVITFAGMSASNSKVAQFDEDWRRVLNRYKLKSLHMVGAARHTHQLGNIPAQTLEERIEVLKPFIDCINTHMELVLLLAWDVVAFLSMSPVSLKKLGQPDTPHYTAFTRGMLQLVDYYHRPEDKISLVCDDDEETSQLCYYHYKAVRGVYHKARKNVISITFANDRYYPALQAADVVAYLCRLEACRELYGVSYDYEKLLDYAIQERPAPHAQWMKQFSDAKVLQRLSSALDNK